MKFEFKKYLLAVSSGLAMVCAAVPAAQAAWPERPVEIIVPYTPGGATDTVTRAVAERLSQRLGQTFIITNKPGANATIGTAQAARAKPDGYTFVTVLAAHAVNPHLYKLSYSDSDFTPVSQMADLPLFLFVAKDLPVNNLQELIAYGKKHPGELTYASSGTGSSAHLTGANFSHLAGFKMTHVPYKGSAPILTDLLAGRVSMVFDPILVPMQYAKKGDLKVLAITSLERWKDEPGVPTVAESGFPGFAMASWAGLLAPAGTPDEIVKKLADEIVAVVQEPGIGEKFHAAGFVPVGQGPKAFQALIKKDSAMYGDIIRKAGISVTQ
ncbi:tripartite tricarboxylate transporter substrate binding protein [Pusillimonas sp. TS35]|uniref:Bug family tripartite tricarboxylate transporter substrate binding protein n=1 Tax=Paracandidimonas lactea TaxID=2895524 RepID=UPI0013703A8F|nr:tripartite tricarboxylate transporter substrate binding protein [Paracandidimonas lactea]MYN13487.1 tripartite tricarboxylate transporter substrate binding protein [Pusillimonas sp. TS35]